MHSMSTMWTLATFRTSFQHVCVQRIRASYASRGSRCKENCVMLVVGGLRHDSAHLLSRTFNILVACNTCPGAMCTCHRAREDFADAGRRCSGLGPDSRHASGGRGPQSLEGIWVCTWCFLKLPTAANWCDVTIPSHDRLAAIPPSRGQTGVFDRWEKQDEPRSHAVRVLGAICWAEPDPSHIRRGSRGATEFTWSNTCFASRWRRKGLQNAAESWSCQPTACWVEEVTKELRKAGWGSYQPTTRYAWTWSVIRLLGNSFILWCQPPCIRTTLKTSTLC